MALSAVECCFYFFSLYTSDLHTVLNEAKIMRKVEIRIGEIV